MERLKRDNLSDVSDEGEMVRARRDRLGMSVRSLATEAGINRNTLSALEAGDSFNRSTLAKVERALSRLEIEAGIGAPPPTGEAGTEELIELYVGDDVRIVVRGPVKDRDELVESALKLMRGVQAERQGLDKP